MSKRGECYCISIAKICRKTEVRRRNRRWNHEKSGYVQLWAWWKVVRLSGCQVWIMCVIS